MASICLNPDLQIVVFGGSLDHELGRFQIFVIRAALDARQRRITVGGANLFLLEQALQATGHGSDAFGHGGF
jgi:hypothetical protein